jgi:hypothetical protein
VSSHASSTENFEALQSIARESLAILSRYWHNDSIELEGNAMSHMPIRWDHPQKQAILRRLL